MPSATAPRAQEDSGRSAPGEFTKVLCELVSVAIAPAGDARSWRGTLPPSLRMRVPCTLVNDAALEIGYHTGRAPELIDIFHTRDLFIGQLASIFISELDSPEHPAKSLIIESSSCALAAHLLRKYDAFTRKESKLTGLGPASPLGCHVLCGRSCMFFDST